MERLLTESKILQGEQYAITGAVASKQGVAEWQGLPIVGTIYDLPAIAKQHTPDVIIVGDVLDVGRDGHKSRERFNHFLLEAKLFHNVHIESVASVYERLTGKLPIEAYAPEDILRGPDYHDHHISDFIERLVSSVASGLALLLLFPFLLILGVLVRLDSDGPALFVQERVGLNGRRFKLFKFRTMRPSIAEHTEWARDNCERITALGGWLRRFRLDELPQFINVLRGDMNLVGPRPHPASNFELFALTSRNTPESGSEIPFYQLRCSVRPGITGWAQVRYRYANNLDEEIEKLRYDLYYIRHRSVYLNIRILFATIATIIKGHGVAGKPVATPSYKSNSNDNGFAAHSESGTNNTDSTSKAVS
ncbi:lipopolysaccharide/colanic/teichoic acid biosynthesis glycosyltransferase [Litorivivens lipolytica]|uniref:Lipopolysaccharide/colanic/teichoic acid biosynthesis glycosyltransferase n=1 Tax=Litorivivens lipolytica TaxID=1524264 RepID=A0A7W4Z653_9GAMM|nr:sugar transferase [Litorivivens lipolytica]MBB3047822.1 lipopolysaccharide/colanic/teichoic acid biosynthesis glycosyltransferase [Litorivivens lipolytica]